MSTCTVKKIIALVVIWVMVPLSSFAGGLSSLGYDGFLTNSAGVPQNGTAPVTVRIYDAEIGGNLLYEEIHPAIEVAAGYFTVRVGSVGDSNSSTLASSFRDLSFNTDYFITTELGAPFNTGEMTLSGGLRAPIVVQPYSYASRALTTKTTAPSNPNIGEIYYDTVQGKVLMYDGVSWKIVSGEGVINDSSLIADGAITGSDVAASTITLDKLQNLSGLKLLGNSGAEAATVSEVGLGSGLSFSAGLLSLDLASNYNWTGINSFTSANGITLDPFASLSGSTTALKFSELASNGTNYVGFRAPDSITANTVWKLPGADGVNGQVLGTDGSGNLSWVTASGGGAAVSGSAGRIQFAGTSGDLASSSQLFWNTNNNRLGIGTSTPTASLSIAGGNIDHFSLGSSPQYSIGDSSNNGSYGFMRWNSTNNTLNLGTQLGGNTLRISNSGRLGINGNAPNNDRVSIQATSADSNALTLSRSETSGRGMGYISFKRGDGAEMGYITCNLNSPSCSLNSASDIRLKENISDSVKGLMDLMQIEVRDYTFKNDPTHTRVQGFLAQQLHTIYPDAVSPGDTSAEFGEGSKLWAVDYARLTPLLVRSVQENQYTLNNYTLTMLDSGSKVSDLAALGDSQARSPVDYISERVAAGSKYLFDLVAGQITAVNGYFTGIYTDKIEAKSVVTDELCYKSNGILKCFRPEQLEEIISSSAESQSAITTPSVPDLQTPVQDVDESDAPEQQGDSEENVLIEGNTTPVVEDTISVEVPESIATDSESTPTPANEVLPVTDTVTTEVAS